MHDWNSFGLRTGQHFGPRCAPNVISLQCRATQQKQSRVRKVATPARTGEKGRAQAAARNSPPVPVTEQIVQEIKSLYPADPEPPAPAQAFVSGLFLSEVAEHIPTTLRKMPRLNEPGPHGMRAEHWYDFGLLRGTATCLCKLLPTLQQQQFHTHSYSTLKAGQITATRQTHRWPQTTSHDVLSPQVGAQGISG